MKRNSPSSQSKPKEQGSALVLAVFVLVLLTGMGTALLFMSQNEMKMGRANLQTKQAFYMAEAGLENGRLSLFNSNGKGSFTDDLENHSADVAAPYTLDFDPDTVTAVFDADGNLTGLTGYTDTPLTPPTAFGAANGVEGWFASFLTNDPVEHPSATDGDDRVMITGVGVGPGGSMEVVQAIIEKVVRFPPIPPAAITLLGPTPTFCSGSSNSSDYDGNDCGTGPAFPVVGTVGSAAQASAESGYYKTNNNNGPDFHTAGNSITGKDTFADLDNAGDPLVSTPIADAWKDCQSMHDLVEEMRAEADWICTNNCTPPVGSTVGQILFIDQPTQLTVNTDGAGTLVVTGDMRFGGGSNWDGMIMVIGEGDIGRSGGGSGVISGAVIVADVAGPDNIYGNADDCTGGPAGDGFGIANYCVNGGGNGSITYCSASINAANPLETYQIVEFLQH